MAAEICIPVFLTSLALILSYISIGNNVDLQRTNFRHVFLSKTDGLCTKISQNLKPNFHNRISNCAELAIWNWFSFLNQSKVALRRSVQSVLLQFFVMAIFCCFYNINQLVFLPLFFVTTVHCSNLPIDSTI